MSTALAILAVIISAGSILYASRSATASERSAAAAQVSADEATRANELAERADIRTSTSNDVEWHSRLNPDQTKWIVVNAGDDDAHDVHVVLQFAHHRLEAELGVVRGHGGYAIAADLTNDLQSTLDQAAERERRLEGTTVISFAQPQLRFDERIVWHNAAGVKAARKTQSKALRWADSWIEIDPDG